MNTIQTTKTILAIDTAMGACSVGLFLRKKNQVVAISEDMKHGQAERLIPMVKETLAQAQTAYKEIDAIITTTGPGGFTGLRVGLSAAKALALTLNKPLFGITTLQALALSYDAKADFSVVVDTRRDDFYIQDFDAQAKPLSDAQLRTAEHLELRPIIIGDGAQRALEQTKAQTQFAPVLKTDMTLILPKLDQYQEYLTQDPQPTYLRGADISQPKKKQRVLKA